MAVTATEATMIGHASVLIRHGAVSLLTDPWLGGVIFNDSWELLSPPALQALEVVTHIWISHEHPDHLHFPSLRGLPESLRERCTILVQEHPSPSPVEALESLGFARVVELRPGSWTAISDEVELLCIPSRRIDSLLAVRTSAATILDLNDCKLRTRHARQVARAVGAVDLLLGQFSIASWPANRAAAPTSEKRFKVASRCAGFAHLFKAKLLVPVGSFVHFCHAENRYMNDWALPPDEAEQYLREACPCEVALLYPGDFWRNDSGAVRRGDAAARYRSDWSEAMGRPGRVSDPVEPVELVAAGQRLADAVAQCIPAFVRRWARPVHFFAEDWGQAICFDLGLRTVGLTERSREQCHFALHSQTLAYAFAHRWGIDTLDISGRYEVLGGPKSPFAFWLCDAASAGWRLGFPTPRQIRRWWAKRGEFLDWLERRFSHLRKPSPSPIRAPARRRFPEEAAHGEA